MSIVLPHFGPHTFLRRNRGGGASPLLTALVAYWKKDEVSGNRASEVNSHTLTDVNTVTSTTGVQGNAAVFASANSEALTMASHADVTLGNADVTLAGWVYFTTTPAQLVGIVGKHLTGAREYVLFKDTDQRLKFRVYNSSNAEIATAAATTFGAVTTDTWYLVECGHDAANDLLWISVNAGVRNTAATSGTSPASTATTFALAGLEQGTSLFLNGRMDEWGIWRRVLTEAEVDDLYNGGSGTTHPFLA